MGIGLSAACGFRVFVPLLIMNLASLSGYLQLFPGFEWIGSPYTSIVFGTTTLAKVLAYYIPWFDHILDLIASPSAVLELMGSIITALLAMIVPVLCLILIATICIFVTWKAGRFFIGRMKIK